VIIALSYYRFSLGSFPFDGGVKGCRREALIGRGSNQGLVFDELDQLVMITIIQQVVERVAMVFGVSGFVGGLIRFKGQGVAMRVV